MVKVGVIGATGYAGAELVRILSGHPKAKITLITSRQYAGMRFDKVFPSMGGHARAKSFRLNTCVKERISFSFLFHIKYPWKLRLFLSIKERK